MDHFRYINTIRKPDGTLRDWKEHDVLVKYEQCADIFGYTEHKYPSKLAKKIKDKEYAKRS